MLLMRKRFFIVILILILATGGYFIFHKNSVPASQTKKSNTSTTPATSASFNKNQYSLTDPTSIWVVVNKQHPLNPKDYIPPDLVFPNVPLRVPGNESMQLRKVTANAMEQMFTDAKSQGINLMLLSGYRSYSYQVGLYNGYVQANGQAEADQQSARPGYSEHQTGFAADVGPVSQNCALQQCFSDTPEGKWLAANAYKYGFIVRYAADDQDITGYEAEPWHIRYVGVELSTEMHDKGIQTLEQFFNVSGGAVYRN